MDRVRLRLPELQWGRNLTVAEGANAVYGGNAYIQLQWGRNLTVAEGVGQVAGLCPAFHWLQWGRNLTVAEGSPTWRAWTTAPRFNGAAT